MKIGFISDIHGNLMGLNTCLEFLNKMNVDKIFCLGDLVGYLPDPSKAILRIKNLGISSLLGNVDAMFLGTLVFDKKKAQVYRIDEARKSVSSELKDYMSTLLPWSEMTIGGKKLLLVHGSPSNPLNGYVYPDSDISYFKNWDYDAIFMGNTHHPFIKKIDGNKLIVNVGSSGLPRDQGDLSACTIYDTGTHSCEIFRLNFDAKKLLSQYENKIHPSVVDCLKRRSENIFGKIVNA